MLGASRQVPSDGGRCDNYSRAMTLVLRAANPVDHNDARRYAHYLDIAADGYFTEMFGSTAEQRLAQASLTPDTELSLSNVVFVEIDGQVRGMCSGMLGEGKSVVNSLTRGANWRTLMRAGMVVAVTMPVLAALERRAPDEWYLQSLAVDSDLRGQGVGGQLFDDAIRRARASGAAKLTLDVASSNPRARALYERLGMHCTGTSWPALVRGSLRVHRMELPL